MPIVPVSQRQCLRGINWGKVELKSTTMGELGNKTDVTFESLMEPHQSESSEILRIPMEAITDVSGSAKELNLKISTAVEKELLRKVAGDVNIDKNKKACFLEGIKFAVPSPCVGFEQSVDAGRELQDLVKAALAEGAGGSAAAVGTAALTAANEAKKSLIASATGKVEPGVVSIPDAGKLVCVMENLNLLQPSATVDLVLTTTMFMVTDAKKNITISVRANAVDRMVMLPVGGMDDEPEKASQYFALILNTPVSVGSTEIHNLVFQFASSDIITEENPFSTTASTEKEIKELFSDAVAQGFPVLVTPKMTGPRAEVVAKTIKTTLRKPLSGDSTEFSSEIGAYCTAMPTVFKGSSGFLYVLTNYLLFMHRPATLIAYDIIKEATIDTTGSTTFSLELKVKKGSGKMEKMRFGSLSLSLYQSAITKLLQAKLKGHGTVNVLSKVGDDVEEVEEEDDDDEEEVEEVEESDEDASVEESDEDISDKKIKKLRKHSNKEKEKRKHKRERED